MLRFLGCFGRFAAKTTKKTEHALGALGAQTLPNCEWARAMAT